MPKFQPNCTLNEFDRRLEAVFPNSPMLVTITDPATIKSVLLSVLREPLVFPPQSGIPDDAIWWFRGGESFFLTGFKHLGGNRFVIQGNGDMELNIEKIVVYRNSAKQDLSFVYLECSPDKPDHLTPEYIQQSLKDTPSSQYVMEIFDDEDRMQMVTKFNCFIAPKESRLNNTGGIESILLDKLCNSLIWDNGVISDATIRVLEKLPDGDYYAHLRGY
jgi:hypothetical protein